MKRLLEAIMILFLLMVSFTSKADINENLTVQFGKSITVKPMNDLGMSYQTPYTMYYTLSDKSAFTVQENSSNHTYTLKAQKIGTFLFTVKVTVKGISGNYTYYTIVYTIDVSYDTGTTTVLVSNITISKTNCELFVGEQIKLDISVSPSNATNKTILWSSSNDNIATVNANGLVTGVNEGTCIVIASTTDGSNLSAGCQIIVKKDSEAKEAYAVLNQEGLLAFYYDSKKGERSGLAFAISSSEGDNNPSWNQNYTKITKVCFDTSFSKYRPTNTSFWFSGCSNLKDIEGIANLNTSEVVSMREMFGSCSNLQSLDVSHFNTSKVTNMHKMFIWCGNLTELDVSNFDTSNVTDMKEMFNGCSKLKYIDVSHFDTGKAVFMDELFHRCYSLESVDVSNFKTDQTDNLHEMFKECRSLVSLDLSSFNTKQVTQMYRMFWGCTALKTIYVGNGWSTEKVDNSDSMFRSCSSLVGGKGTTFDENHIDHTYAHVDGGVNNPGYLTGKTEPTSNVWGDLNGDGVVDVADIAVIINIIASQTRED